MRIRVFSHVVEGYINTKYIKYKPLSLVWLFVFFKLMSKVPFVSFNLVLNVVNQFTVTGCCMKTLLPAAGAGHWYRISLRKWKHDLWLAQSFPVTQVNTLHIFHAVAGCFSVHACTLPSQEGSSNACVLCLHSQRMMLEIEAGHCRYLQD